MSTQIALPIGMGQPIWGEQQRLTGSDARPGDRFGWAVALEATTALVGAPSQGDEGGAVYVFERTGNAWSERQQLAGSDSDFNDQFGQAVALSGDTVLVGAPQGNGFDGEAYVFTRSGSGWTEQQRLIASDGAETFSRLGISVALSGNVAVLSSQDYAYVFERSGSTWTEQQKLAPADGARIDSVYISGDTVLAAASNASSQKGAAYVFVHKQGAWTEQQKLVAADGKNGDWFGWYGAIAGDSAILANSPGSSSARAVYVFVRSGTVWSQQQKLTPNPTWGDYTSGVALYGDTMLVGAGSAGAYGLAYPFSRSGGSWTASPALEPSQADGEFGGQSSLAAGYALIGSADAAYVFHFGLQPGDDCSLATDCVKGVCSSEGVCCDAECDNDCESCLASRKGSGADGVCGPIAVDTDPRDDCATTESTSCGLTGACDGAGACAWYSAGAECDPASCPTRTSENPSDVCDGAGACSVQATVACEVGYVCEAGACKTSCESDADCDDAKAFVCGSGVCKVPSAEPCKVDTDCDSEHCADGLCCDQACSGQCEACAEPGHEGICVAVTGTPRGKGRPPCETGGDAACGARCDGVRREACRFVPATTACGCANNDAANLCDGEGLCSSDAPVSCGGFVCQGDACLLACVDDQDCSTGFGCSASGCVPTSMGAECSDDLTESRGVDGTTGCSPYLCEVSVGACLKRCETSLDCAAQFACNRDGHRCEAVSRAAPDNDGCGCRTAAGSHQKTGLWLALVGLLLAQRRKRERESR